MSFNDLIKNIGNTVKKATDKLDNTVDVQKIKYQISKKEDEIKEVYSDLGRAVVEAALSGGDHSAALAKALEEIAKKREEIAALEKERRDKEGKALCGNCHAEVAATDEFCSRCGAKREREASDANSEETDATSPA